ncbi:hypothetical protein [Ligilactobacillus cholophilus]|uniref:hypothetical protein n=1 Tax=Ligilactobacillus cholophilus TaxID=3050131 RepID=UPI0025B0EDEF|nr:hypothetical protein [Ligilactobacillus cholophilus]
MKKFNDELYELFPDDEMQRHSKFKNLDDFMGNLGVKNQNEFDNLSDDLLDKFVKENTDFDNWKAMDKHANQIYLQRQKAFNL